MCHMRVWRSEDNLYELVLFIHHVSPSIKHRSSGLEASILIHRAILPSQSV